MKKNYFYVILFAFSALGFQNSASAQGTAPTTRPTSRVVEDGGTG